MDCLIFDFDGVIVDSEPVHLEGFRQVLAQQGIALTTQEYYQRYLGYDDHDCFVAVMRDKAVRFSEDQIAQMTAQKTALVQQAFSKSIEPLPGARELIVAASAAGVPMAICSGALLAEIRMAAKAVGVLDCFSVIIAARDVRAGKPDPQGYLLAFQRLQEAAGRPMARQRSIVIEDSPAGIEAGKAAGMAVLAVATSYPPDQLAQADHVLPSLSQASLDLLETLVAQR